MNSVPSRHPEPESLLRYVDGELAARHASQVRTHLEACWECRAELDGIEHAAANCVRYRGFLAAELPPPPAPWRDLSSAMRRVDDAAARRRSWGPAFRWTALAAGAALAIWLGVTRWTHPPSAQAAELLRRAVAASESRPAKPRQYRIRTRTAGLERARIAQSFAAARFDLDSALSPKAYFDWYNTLADREDEVVAHDDRLRVCTTTSSSELVEATLELRRADLEAVQGTFRFRDDEWVEITAVDDSAPVLTAAARVPAPRLPAPLPAPTAAPLAEPPVSELDVLTALHRLGADLGDPIEVRRAAGRIVVAGTGVDPERRAAVEQALRGAAGVTIEFAEPAAVTTPDPPTAAPNHGGRAEWATRLEKTFGSRALADEMASAVLDESESLMARAHALRRLSERFPPRDQAALPEPDRAKLAALVHAHSAALAAHAAAIAKRLNPILGELGSAAASLPPAAGTFLQARTVERGLSELFGAATPATPTANLPAVLATNLDALAQGAK